MRQFLFAMGVVFALTSFASAENLVFIRDGRFLTPDDPKLKNPGTFDMRGIELTDWSAASALAESDRGRGKLQPLALHGLNTIAIALQGSSGAGRFWSPDGKTIDPKAAAAFTDIASQMRDHWFALVVSMFSADKSCWLESPDAYREAAKSVAKLLPEKHSCIFVVGDLLGSGDWKGSPFPEKDTSKLIEMCRLIQAQNADAIVGLAEAISNVQFRPDPDRRLSPNRRMTFFAAQNPDDLDLSRSKVLPLLCKPWWLLTRSEVSGNYAAAVEKFALQVERDRVSVKLPAPAIEGKPPTEIVTEQEKAKGWIPLFDGKSLEGWTTLTDNWGGWSVEDGELKCAGTSGPWIRTVKRYGSFALRLQFNISPNGNSGVFIRAPYDARASRFGMEVQILGTHKDKPDKDTTGAIYSARAPLQEAGREPGQWNDLEVICDGDRVIVRLNNQIVQDFHMAAEPALKGRLMEGCIGLQDHGNSVSFRKIRIKGHMLSSPVDK